MAQKNLFELKESPYNGGTTQNTAAVGAGAPAAAKPYYAMPEIGANTQELYDAAKAAERAVRDSQSNYTQRYALVQEKEEAMALWSGMMQQARQKSEQSGSAWDAAYYGKLQQTLISQMGEFAQVKKQLDAAEKDYTKNLYSYNTAVSNYNQYVTEQQKLYSDWRGTVRGDSAQIQAELDAVSKQLSELQAQENANKMIYILGQAAYAAQGGTPEYKPYGESAQLEALARRKALLEEELYWNRGFGYESLRENSDFAEKSQYKSTANGRTRDAMAISAGVYYDDGESGWDDPLYEYINTGNKDALAYIRGKAAADYGDAALARILAQSTDGKTEAEHMSQREKEIYNYLHATQGASAAQEYYKYIQTELTERERKALESYMAEWAQKDAVGSSVFSIVMAPAKGLSYIGQAMDYLDDGEIDENAGYNKFSYGNTAIRNAVAQQIKESGEWGEVGSFAYQTGMSMADFLLNTAISGGNGTLSMLIMGSGAAADTTIAAKDRGLNDDQAFALGAIAGAAEAITERFSLEALLKPGNSKTAVMYILKNALTEGSEEGASTLINTMADIIISKDKSEWAQSIQAYKNAGKSEGEAFGLAMADQAKALGLDILGGFISGGAMGGGGAAINHAGAVQTGQAIGTANPDIAQIQSLILEGLSNDPSTRSNYLAQQLQQKLMWGEKLSNTDLGKLYQANQQVEAEQRGTNAEAAQKAMAELAQKMEESQTVGNEQQTQVDSVEQQAQRLSKLLGREIVLYSEEATENGIRNGYYENGKIYVNTKSADPVAQIVSHELTHSVEFADVYEELSQVVLGRIAANGTDLNKLRQQTASLYAANDAQLKDNSEIDKEIVANYVARQMLSDEQSIVELVREKPSLGRRILNWLNNLLAKLGNKNAKERAFLSKAKDLYSKALGQSRTSFTEDTRKAAPVAEDAGNQTPTNPELEEMVAWMRQQYANGDMTEEEFDSMLDSIMEYEERNAAAEPPEVKHSISPTFASEIDQWSKAGMPEGESFELGATGDVLQGLGAIESDIYMLGDKIQQILLDHPEMTLAEIKKIPQILEDPVLILKSRNSGRRDASNTRLVVFGAIKAQNGQPMLAVLDLRPVEKNLVVDDMQKVSSAYTKTSNPQDFISKSDVLYADKNRTARLLKSIGFRMPIELQQSGYIGSISYFKRSVNIGGKRFSEVIGLSQQGSDNPQYSISGSTVRRQDVVSDLREILNHGGGAAELRQYIAQMEQSAPEAYQNADFSEQEHAEADQTATEAEQIVKAARERGISVTEHLQQNWEQYDVDGQWNEAARKALVMESGRRQYSVGAKENSADVGTDQRKIYPGMNDVQGVSISGNPETETGEADAEQPEIDGAKLRAELPAKARDYLKGVERKMLNDLASKLCVPYSAKREYLMPIVEELSNEYLQNGMVSEKTVQRLFNKAYEQGMAVNTEFYDMYKEVKDHLRTVAVTISDTDKADIADFADFRKRAFGSLRLVNEGGLPVDSCYQELREMAPELFPDYITHPADQLQKMLQVSKSIRRVEGTLREFYGKDEAAFRRWAKSDFDAAIGDIGNELQTVKRYAEEKTAEKETKVPLTPQEAMGVYAQLKEARRNYEKVMAKNLLTEQDEAILGDLLAGKRTLESLDPEEDNVKGITAVYEAKREMAQYTQLITQYKRSLHKQHRDLADKHLETANEWKDKAIGIAYSRETMRRNVQDIIPDIKVAAEVNKIFFEPVAMAEAAATRFKEQYRNKVRELNLSRKVRKGNAVSEAHAVQLLGEAMDNIAMIERARGRMKHRDGKTLTEWEAIVTDLWKENPGLDRKKIEHAVDEFRKIYDELFVRMNEVRVANGYEPVNYRKGYFPHFQPGESDGILAHFGKALGISTDVVALPTTINGLTHTFKPGIQWFGNAQERLGFNTAYDAIEGFDKYIEGVASVIHQTENIQRLRALATQIRYRTSNEGLRDQVDKVRAREDLTEEQQEALIADIYSKGKFGLSNFVVELDEYTNLLANKKSKLDRTVEAMMGRKMYTFMKWWEGRVGANMIAGNISSALTNFIPLTQAGAQLDRGALVKGIWKTLCAIKQSDLLIDRSDFVTNRRGSDPLVETWVQKASKVAGKPMELIDSFVSESIVRAAYYQNVKRGMSEADAMHYADIFAADVMADRSKGAMPTLFASSNPLIKLFTQFQLEVNNQFSEVFKDLPRGFKEKGLKTLAWVLFKYFVGAWLYNEVFERLFGRRSALDPLGILNETVGDFSGYELPNLLELIGGAVYGDMPSFETERLGLGEAIGNLGNNLLSELPFSAGLTLIGVETDGGRIPASSAIPDLTVLKDALFNTEWSAEKRWKEAADEIAKPLTYIIPPFGGNQLSKAWKGLSAYFAGGSYTVDKDGNDILQYPIFKDGEKDSFLDAIKAGIMGKSSMPEAKKWVDSGFDSFSAKQTMVYQDLLAAGVKDRDAYSLLRELEGAAKTETMSKYQAQRKILDGSAISDEGKAIVFYGLVATESDRELMDKLADLGADSAETGKVAMGLRDTNELKGVEKKQARSDLLIDSGLTDEEKTAVMETILGSELLNENGNPTQYAKLLCAVETGLPVDSYLKLYGVGADMDKYFDFVDAGLDPEDAVEATFAFAELEPEEGKEQVANIQRWEMCVEAFADVRDQLLALRGTMTDSQYEKAEIASNYGVSPRAYVKFLRSMTKYDADGNGKYTQAEVKVAVDAMGGASRQKAALWQLITGSASAKNNPYSTDVGQKVIDARKGKENTEEVISFSELVMQQLLENWK